MKKTVKKKSVAKKKKAAQKSRVVKTRNGGTWTEAQYFSAIRAALRSKFRFWVPMMNALKKSSRPSQNKQNKRLKTEYQCAHCKNWYSRKEVEIDHIQVCGSLSCMEDIVPFLKRLTIEDEDGYQILCKPCHINKSSVDREIIKQRKLLNDE